jgi:hypothetical protein
MSDPQRAPDSARWGADPCSMAGVYLGSHEKNHVNSQCPPSTWSGAGNRHCTKPSLGIRVSIFFLFFLCSTGGDHPKRFSMSGNDPTEHLALMTKRFEKTVKTVLN